MSDLVLIINKADFQSLIKNVLITNQAQGLYMYLSLLVTATIEILPCTQMSHVSVDIVIHVLHFCTLKFCMF